MLKKIVAATTAAMLCTAAANYASAQDSGGPGGRHHMRGPGHGMSHDELGDPTRMLEMLTRHLDLDATQTQSIGEILESAKPEIAALRERGAAARKAMHDLDVNDPDYDTRLKDLSIEIGNVTSEATLLHGRLRAEVFAQLTPEQRERAAENRDRMRERFHHRGFKEWHDDEPESPDTE